MRSDVLTYLENFPTNESIPRIIRILIVGTAFIIFSFLFLAAVVGVAGILVGLFYGLFWVAENQPWLGFIGVLIFSIFLTGSFYTSKGA